MIKKSKPKTKRKTAALKITAKMKRIAAKVLAGATEMPAEDLVALIYREMDKARRP